MLLTFFWSDYAEFCILLGYMLHKTTRCFWKNVKKSLQKWGFVRKSIPCFMYFTHFGYPNRDLTRRFLKRICISDHKKNYNVSKVDYFIKLFFWNIHKNDENNKKYGFYLFFKIRFVDGNIIWRPKSFQRFRPGALNPHL